MLEASAKLLLRNSIRSADTHNRLFEEQNLWQMHADTSRRKDPKRQQRRSPSFRRNQRDGSSSSCRTYERKRNRSRSPAFRQEMGVKSANVWLRRLADCKEADPDKWHHDGFKELYPEVLAEQSAPKSRTSPSFTAMPPSSPLQNPADPREANAKRKKRKKEKRRRETESRTSPQRREKKVTQEKKHKKKRRKSHD